MHMIMIIHTCVTTCCGTLYVWVIGANSITGNVLLSAYYTHLLLLDDDI